MTEWRGKPVADAIANGLKSRIGALRERGVVPCLAVVRVGERLEDLAYERGLKKRFEAADAAVLIRAFPETVSQKELEYCLSALGRDDSVHGVLLFRPLPKTLDEGRLRNAVPLYKDVDCMSDGSRLFVLDGKGIGFPPCTPQAVLELLDYYGFDLTGKRVAVIGRSMVVGKPLAMLLLNRNATVTICHTRTVNLPEVCAQNDLLISAAGKGGLVGRDFVRPGMAVVDVGVSDDGNGGIRGDVVFSEVASVAEAVTPVPGGVGSVTSAVLLKHTVQSAETV